jgi:immune inhibitor A
MTYDFVGKLSPFKAPERKMIAKAITGIMLVLIFVALLGSSYPVPVGGQPAQREKQCMDDTPADRLSFPTFGPPAPGVDRTGEIPDYVRPPIHKRSLEDMLREAELLPGPPQPQPPPPTGNRKLLVILVYFTDMAGTKTDVYFETMMWGPRPSLQDYYTEVSYGIFTYVAGMVLDPGADNIAPFYYASPYTQAWAATSPNYQTVAAWAIGAADADFNFAPYDTDVSGTVENDELTIVIVTAGIAGDMGGASPWSHHWWTAAPVPTGDGVNVEGEYSMTSEANPMGTHAHELGHDLGLPDLYDIDGGSEGIGEYGLMGSGCWLGPTHMTAWSKIQLGWLTPTMVTTSSYYNVRDVETYAEAYILYDPTYSTTEYFLVENRWRGTSYDNIASPYGKLPDEGILIYHIDDLKAQDWWISGTNNVNVDEAHKGVDVECADSPTSHIVDADDLDKQVNRGDSTDLWDNTEYDFHDGSTPCNANWYVTVPSGMDVREFPAPAATMTVFLSVKLVTPPPVGGVRIPVDKFGLLAPYIGLASTILVATAATAIYIKRVKRRKEKQ